MAHRLESIAIGACRQLSRSGGVRRYASTSMSPLQINTASRIRPAMGGAWASHNNSEMNRNTHHRHFHLTTITQEDKGSGGGGDAAAAPAAATDASTAPFASSKTWQVYLSGEIHSDWREVIADGIKKKGLPVHLTSPNTSHEDSDDCGAIILGMEEKRTNWDKIGANMNNIRTKTLIKDADLVVVRFGEKYRQWNAAFDAGYAAALGKSIITLHPPKISHMLKEVNANASVVCEDAEQVVESLAYVIRGELPETPRDGDDFVPIADRLGAGNPNP